MRFLFFNAFIKAYSRLIYFDILMSRANYAALSSKARLWPIATRKLSPEAVECVRYAMDMACIWYCKEVLCLQRSAATCSLLRDYGEPAEMVIGTQIMPHKTHAWVEIDGRVINDKPYMREKYLVLEQATGAHSTEALT